MKFILLFTLILLTSGAVISAAKLGEACDDTSNPCNLNQVCDTTCKRYIGKGKSCTDTTKFLCNQNLACQTNGGDPNNKTCKQFRGKGKDCTDSTRHICNRNFVCESNGGDPVVKTCKAVRGRGQDCSDSTRDICSPNFVCESNAGVEADKTCKKARGIYRPCGNRHFTCKSPFTCPNGVCAKTVAPGKRCDESGLVCGPGYSCQGTTGRKKCKLPAIGKVFQCGPTSTYTFISDTEADLVLGTATGKYVFTYDGAMLKATGMYGYSDQGACTPAGGPVNSGDFGNLEFTFNPEFTTISGSFTVCDGTQGPFDCTLVVR